MDRDCCQTLCGRCKTHFQPAGGTDRVGYVLDIKNFGEMRAIRSVIETVRAGDDDRGLVPDTLRVELRGTSDDLSNALEQEIQTFGTLLTYTTVDEIYRGIVREETF